MINGVLYIYGGWDQENAIDRDSLLTINLETEEIQLYENQPPQRREGHSAQIIDGEIWIFGGICFNCDLNNLENVNVYYSVSNLYKIKSYKC